MFQYVPEVQWWLYLAPFSVIIGLFLLFLFFYVYESDKVGYLHIKSYGRMIGLITVSVLMAFILPFSMFTIHSDIELGAKIEAIEEHYDMIVDIDTVEESGDDLSFYYLMDDAVNYGSIEKYSDDVYILTEKTPVMR